jgi:hypothetical protein
MPSFQPWFIELTNIIHNLAVALAAILGIMGLWQWRKELVGKAKFEVAQKMMVLALQFRDEYIHARDPWTYPYEWAERKKSNNESKGECEMLNEYFARSRRLLPLRDILRKFNEVSWEAEVVLSEKDAKLIQPFEKTFKTLTIAIESFFENKLDRICQRQLELPINDN